MIAAILIGLAYAAAVWAVARAVGRIADQMGGPDDE